MSNDTTNTFYKQKLKMKIAVVIPCYRVKNHILNVLNRIGGEVSKIYVVDDQCPEQSGQYVLDYCNDPRVCVIKHTSNTGVDGAVMSGYRAALNDQMDIAVKIDGDNQMDPALIRFFTQPIELNQADYTKGNRFYNIERITQMPTIRLIGNSALSFMCKLSSGYWRVFDPTNGYTAIHLRLVQELPLNKISQRYFFESDLLFRLNTLRAKVVDIPMHAQYADEISNLKIHRIIGVFFISHCKNTIKRIFYNYYLRDMSVASIELPLGLTLLLFGIAFGGLHWLKSMQTLQITPYGTVMIAMLSILIGIQLLLAFLAYDMTSSPTEAYTLI